MQNLLEILGKVGFDWQVALANFVNFLIVFFILKKYAFGPIKKVILDRQEKIKQGIEDAEKAKNELLKAEFEKEEVLKDARTQANMLVSEINKNKNEIIAEAKDKAENEAALVKTKSIEEISKMKSDFDQEIKEKGTDLILSGIEKLLNENLTKEQSEKFSTSLLK